MKDALKQLRQRLYSMLKEEEKTISMTICARDWKQVSSMCASTSTSTSSSSKSGEEKCNTTSSRNNATNIFHDRSCHNRYPLQLALQAGAPYKVILAIIRVGGITAAKANWKSGRGLHTPLQIAHRQGNQTRKDKNSGSNKLINRVWKYKHTLIIKQAIWSILNEDVHHNLSTGKEIHKPDKCLIF